jgi:1-hydroxy-2-naphthoate dioxygenase
MSVAPGDRLTAFDAELAQVNMFGQWNAEAALIKLTDGPKPLGTPHVWRWDTVHELLRKACLVFPDSLTARRNFTFVTPGLPRRGTTQTLIMGMQLVLPGEIAPTHRHSLGALRFVVAGSPQLSTVVSGEKVPMETNDLILTPSYTWHDHHNQGTGEGIWLDVLDVPLIMGINQTFYEPYDGQLQPQLDPQPPTSAFRYPWSSVEPLLQKHANDPGSPYDGVRLGYAGLTGMPTMACFVQTIRAGCATREHRHTPSVVYHVVSGRGTTTIDGVEIAWQPRDSFAVPGWARHSHRADQGADAILFSVTDEPLITALGLYREDPEDSRDAMVIMSRIGVEWPT